MTRPDETGSAVPHESLCPVCALGAYLAEHAGNAPRLAPAAFSAPDPYEDTQWARFFALGGNQPLPDGRTEPYGSLRSDARPRIIGPSGRPRRR